jgi:hypothetical protein
MYSGSGLRGSLLGIIPKTLLLSGDRWLEKRMLGRSLSCVRATCRPWALHLFESGVDVACGSAVEAFKSPVDGLH